MSHRVDMVDLSVVFRALFATKDLRSSLHCIYRWSEFYLTPLPRTRYRFGSCDRGYVD